MTTQIKSPYPVFYDSQANPLQSGYVYVGTANLNAETNPISCYFDTDLTIPANQPLRTINGHISNNGTPANIYTSVSDYSIVVKDKAKVIVYSALTRTSETSAEEINYKNTSYSGGIQQDLNILLSRKIDVKDFGLKGDGITNDTTAFNALLTQLGAGGGYIYFSDGQYLQESALSLHLSQKLEIEFSKNAILIPATQTFDMIRCIGSRPSAFVNLSADSLKTSNSITVASLIANANVGDWLGIRSDALLTGANTKNSKQYINRKIVAISGTTYYFNDTLDYDFLTADSAGAGLATIREKYDIYGLNINNLDYGSSLWSRGVVGSEVYGLNLIGGNIIGNKVRGSASVSGRSAVNIYDGINCNITDLNLDAIAYYGVAFVGASENCQVSNIYGNDTRHLVDITWASTDNTYEGQPSNIRFNNLTSKNSTESGFSTHDTGKDISFDGCKAYNSGTVTSSYGFYFRNSSLRCTNSKSYNATLDGFRAEDTAFAVNLNNVEAIDSGRYGININNYGRVSNFTCTRNANHGVVISGGSLNNGIITDNTGSAIFQTFYSGDNGKLLISNIDAPASANQTSAYKADTANGVEPQYKTFFSGKNNIIGYGDNLFLTTTGGANTKSPMTDGQVVTAFGTSSNPICGYATLVAGTATVTTNAVRKYNPTTGFTTKFTHNVHTRVHTYGGTAGNIRISAITDATSFVITSDSVTDTSTIFWYLGV